MSKPESKSKRATKPERNLRKLFPLIQGFFSPKVIGEVNDAYVKITRVKGHEVPWHTHDHEDEMFYIVKGSLTMELVGEESFLLGEGEFFIVKRGVEHRVYSDRECWVMLIENKSTRHTGSVQSSITKSIDDQLQ
jgi:quercetin dioxygenase-like cupin family protein